MLRTETILTPPYGGTLVNLCVPDESRPELDARALRLPHIVLSERATCDLELLAVGAFSPVSGFMKAVDVARVLEELRMADGTSPRTIDLK